MILRALALSLLLRGAVSAAPAFTILPPGRYSVAVRGMMCTVCARAVAAEWARLPAVEKAEADFARGQAVVTVRLDSSIPVSALRKALRRAEKTANLGARFELGEISYLP